VRFLQTAERRLRHASSLRHTLLPYTSVRFLQTAERRLRHDTARVKSLDPSIPSEIPIHSRKAIETLTHSSASGPPWIL